MPFDDEDSWMTERMPYTPNWNHNTKERETPMNDNKTNPADYVCSNPDCPCKAGNDKHRLALSDEHKIAFLLGICTRMAQALEVKGFGEAYTVLSAFAAESLETVKIMPPDVLREGDEATDELIKNAQRIVADPVMRYIALMVTALLAGR